MLNIFHIVNGTNISSYIVHNKDTTEVTVIQLIQRWISASQDILHHYLVGFWYIIYSYIDFYDDIFVHLHLYIQQNTMVPSQFIDYLEKTHSC